jgi:hypothetical protein
MTPTSETYELLDRGAAQVRRVVESKRAVCWQPEKNSPRGGESQDEAATKLVPRGELLLT